MNFEQWFDDRVGNYDYPYEKGFRRDGWNACKEEVLKILEKKRETIWRNGAEDEIIELKAIELVKNL